MILKEAYRYSNYLSNLTKAAMVELSKSDVKTKTKQTHCKAIATNGRVQDEVLESQSDIGYTATDLIDLLVQIENEYEKLSAAISAAKAKCNIDIDTAIATNKTRRTLAKYFEALSKTKSSETKIPGTDYMLNDVDGKQQSYRYDINVVTTIDFDRNSIKALARKYNKECDEISSQIDYINVTAEVNYDPVWDVDTELEDILSE